MSQEFEQFKEKWQFGHYVSSPYHQQSNGKAENSVKTAKNLIIKSREAGEDV